MAAGVLQEQAMLELGAVDTNELLQLLECPVCLDHITPPVKQCIKVLTYFYLSICQLSVCLDHITPPVKQCIKVLTYLIFRTY